MTQEEKQKATGWGIVVIVLLLLYWLSKYGLSFLHGTQTTVVQSGIVGGEQNQPTTTQYPCC